MDAVTKSLNDGAYKALLSAFDHAVRCELAITHDNKRAAVQEFAYAWEAYGSFAALAARLPRMERADVYSTVIDGRDGARLLGLLEECRVRLSL